MEKSESYRLKKSIINLYDHIEKRIESGMPPITDALYSKAPNYVEIKDRARALFDYIVDNDNIELANIFAQMKKDVILQRFEQCFNIEFAADTPHEIKPMLDTVAEIYMEMSVLVGQSREYVRDMLHEEHQQEDAENKIISSEPFLKALNLEYIEKQGNRYKWKKTKQLLAYFAEKLSQTLHLSSKMDKDGNITISWKPFERLFDTKDLKGAKANWMRATTTFYPTDCELIDILFD